MVNLDFNVLVFLTGFVFALPIIGYLFRFNIPISIFFLLAGTFMIAIFLATDGIILDSFSQLESEQTITTNGTEIVREYIYNVNFTQDVQLSTTATTGAEFASNSSSLIGSGFQCMEILLARTSTLPDNPIYFGIMNNTGHLTFNFTSFQPSDIMTDAEQYEACLPTDTFYTIQAQDRIGAKSIIVAGSRSYIMYQDNTNPFDGTNSYRQGFNPSTMTWSGATNNDMTMKLYNNTIVEIPLAQTTFTYHTEDNIMDISFEGENFQIKVIMIFISVMFLVGGALVEVKQR